MSNIVDNRIVSMIEYNGKILVATPSFVYDITNGMDNAVVIFSSEAASKTVMGKKYELVEMQTQC